MKKPRFQAIGRLLREFKPHRTTVVWIVLLGAVVSIIQPFCVKVTEHFIDSLQTGIEAQFFLTTPLLIIGAFVVSGLAKYFYNTMRRCLSEGVVCKLREQLFQHFLFVPVASIQQKKAGELLSSIQNDLVQVSMGLETLYDLLKEPVAFVGLLGVAFYCDWRLALATLVVTPVVVLLFSKSGSAVKRYTGKTLTNFADIVSLGQESLVGAQVVKVFRLETPLLNKFRSIQSNYFQNLRKSIQVQELATPAVEFVGALLMAGVLVYGAYRISIGELTSGKLIAFVIAIGLSQMPIKKLNNSYLRLKIAEAAAERVFALVDAPRPTEGQVGLISVSSFKSDVQFEGVGLRYGDKQVLRDISFRVSRGECVALVGPSGSGKTSIVNLLPRLYEICEGSIKIDGVDIRQFRLDDLRSLMSFVNQETFLFNDSIYENIRYGNPSATKSQVEEAARLANCEPFLKRFPEGFETIVGDRGSRLSGGERQRVAIARSLLKAAPILVLDEATSNLDTESEAMVQNALERLMKDKTTFIVAHRFSTVQRANQIFVIKNGRLEEAGTHKDLLSNQGTYSRLFDHQAFV